MGKFNWSNLVYLVFPIIGIVLSFFAAIGIPGNLDESNPIVKKASGVFDTLFNLSSSGIPLLIIASLIAFYLNWEKLGKSLCIIGFIIGLACIVSLIVLYRVR
jgi:hypothetical protein